ncbi:MAG: hypothetical protein ABI564_18430, partial [Ideonella sp.]
VARSDLKDVITEQEFANSGNVDANDKSAAKNNWAGVLVNGCVRDKAELAAAAVGICALGLNPLPTDRRNEGQRDVPVQIQGVWIRPGDRLVADEDGVVVQPASGEG